MNLFSKGQRCVGILALLVVAGTTSFIFGGENSTRFVPSDSIGYAHIKVGQLGDSLKLPKQLLGHVQKEISDYSMERLGVDVSRLDELTLIAPNFELVSQAGDEPPVVVVATFSTPFDLKNFGKALPDEWTRIETRSGVMLVDTSHEITIFPTTNQTLLIGQKEALNWWIARNKANDQGVLARQLKSSHKNVSIQVGLNATQIPRELRSTIPPEFRALTDANFAHLSIDLGERLTADAILTFDSEAPAIAATTTFESLVKQGRALLTLLEGQMQRQAQSNESSLEDGFGAIAGLALIRQGQIYLDQLKLQREDATVRVTASVDNDITSSIIICLTAIQQIGANAEADFSAIADELGN